MAITKLSIRELAELLDTPVSALRLDLPKLGNRLYWSGLDYNRTYVAERAAMDDHCDLCDGEAVVTVGPVPYCLPCLDETVRAEPGAWFIRFPNPRR